MAYNGGENVPVLNYKGNIFYVDVRMGAIFNSVLPIYISLIFLI